MSKLIMPLMLILSITTTTTAHAWLGSLARLGSRTADDAASSTASRYGQHLSDIPLDLATTTSQAQPMPTIGNTRFDVHWLLEMQRQQLQPAYRRLKSTHASDQVVVQLTVQANGTVSALKLVSSTLKQPSFEQKLLDAIRHTQFAAGQYAVWSQHYTFEFKNKSNAKRR